ncbi:MAG: hypothetical protein LUH07_08025 [Lachnospiraceae bacterium]|nr:hypothetical protein [Lachnospiraceae bacterium]
MSVFLYDAKSITDRLLEQDYIGIVPEKVIPVYCEGLFPGYEISDFMHLPDENLDEVTVKTEWIPETAVKLC